MTNVLSFWARTLSVKATILTPILAANISPVEWLGEIAYHSVVVWPAINTLFMPS